MAEPETDDPRETKRQLRRKLFACLKGIPDAEKAAASNRIREVIAARREFQGAGAVAGFIALPSEPDLTPLIEETLSGRNWCLPRVTVEGLIEMRGVSCLDDLVTGEFGIREPAPDVCPRFPENEIDLILLPGVGFSPGNGARLGRGKGHYDRFLQRLRASASPPLIWGVCFSDQLTAFTPESHDQPVDAIITENGFAV